MWTGGAAAYGVDMGEPTFYFPVRHGPHGSASSGVAPASLLGVVDCDFNAEFCFGSGGWREFSHRGPLAGRLPSIPIDRTAVADALDFPAGAANQQQVAVQGHGRTEFPVRLRRGGCERLSKSQSGVWGPGGGHPIKIDRAGVPRAGILERRPNRHPAAVRGHAETIPLGLGDRDFLHRQRLENPVLLPENRHQTRRTATRISRSATRATRASAF